MEVVRVNESPFTDYAHKGLDVILAEIQVDDPAAILAEVRCRALPDATVA